MGEVVQFTPRVTKLTGFLPPDLGVRSLPVAPSMPWWFWLCFGAFAIWFADGWRDR